MKKKVLVYYKGFHLPPGGSEMETLLLLSMLQERGCDVTLALPWRKNIEYAMRKFDFSVNIYKLKIITIKPKQKFWAVLDTFLPFYRTWYLRKLSKENDVCISMYNIIDFGRPAHHFIADINISETAFRNLFTHSHQENKCLFLYRKFIYAIAENVIRPLFRIRSARKIIKNSQECIYPNSFFIEKALRSFYGNFNSTVTYPPTLFECESEVDHRNQLQVNYLGRICEGKKILDIISIVEYARVLSNKDIKLWLAGSGDSPSYIDKIGQCANNKSWIRLVGAVYDKEKETFLLSGTYAIHAERDEAFGISVTEYLKAGLIPIVPDEGGACEIVNSPSLTYHTNEEAANILVKLLDNADFREEQRRYCEERAKFFSRQAYLDRQHKLLNSILGTGKKEQQ